MQMHLLNDKKLSVTGRRDEKLVLIDDILTENTTKADFCVLKRHRKHDCRQVSTPNLACFGNTIDNKTLGRIDKSRAELA